MLNGSQPLMLSLDLMDPLCPNLNLESCVSMRMHTKTTQGHRIIVAIKSLSLRQRQYSVYVGQICVIAKRVTGGAENFHCEVCCTNMHVDVHVYVCMCLQGRWESDKNGGKLTKQLW